MTLSYFAPKLQLFGSPGSADPRESASPLGAGWVPTPRPALTRFRSRAQRTPGIARTNERCETAGGVPTKRVCKLDGRALREQVEGPLERALVNRLTFTPREHVAERRST